MTTSPVKTRFQEALRDVSQVFDDPHSILAADDLTREQKIALLEQWETDLRLLLVATEENMPGTGSGRSAELLTRVRKAMQSLGVTGPDDIAGAANKSGAN
jgi:hypothetical protein